jgi:hypothetical protein
LPGLGLEVEYLILWWKRLAERFPISVDPFGIGLEEPARCGIHPFELRSSCVTQAEPPDAFIEGKEGGSEELRHPPRS